jgi:hypothetical protein
VDTIRNFGSLAGMNTSVEAILNSQALMIMLESYHKLEMYCALKKRKLLKKF